MRIPEDIEAGGLPGLINYLAPGRQASVARAEAEQSATGKELDYEVPDMPLGILNTKDGEAPGTVVAALQDTREKRSSTGVAVAGSMSMDHMLDSRLKYDRTGKEPILLVPQPSDDPNDPLVRCICSEASADEKIVLVPEYRRSKAGRLEKNGS